MSNSDAVKKLKRLRLYDDVPKAGHPFIATTPAVVKACREIICQNPEKSTRKMVNDVYMFRKLMETIANQKLYQYSHQMQKAAFLKEKYELFRKKKAQHLLHGTLAIFKPFLHFFHDEIFAVEADENEKQAPSPYLN
ncbi:unnamed protein product [Caenorhabditis nigoni]